MRASCIDSTDHRTESTRCPGIIRHVVPRTVPRPRHPSPVALLPCVTSPTAPGARPGDHVVNRSISGQSRWRLDIMTGAGGGAGSGARPGRRWDVALSFAGAHRDYAGEVAGALRARGARCFYDADEQVRLWGR